MVPRLSRPLSERLSWLKLRGGPWRLWLQRWLGCSRALPLLRPRRHGPPPGRPGLPPLVLLPLLPLARRVLRRRLLMAWWMQYALPAAQPGGGRNSGAWHGDALRQEGLNPALPRQPPLRGPQLPHQLLTLNVASVRRVISGRLRPLASGPASTIARALQEVRRTPRTVRLTTTMSYQRVLHWHCRARLRFLPLCRKPARGPALLYRRYRAVE